MPYEVIPSCADCAVAHDATYDAVVARRLFVVDSGVGTRVIELYLCNPCTNARMAYEDTKELCIACRHEKPNHGTHCPAGPDHGSLD